MLIAVRHSRSYGEGYTYGQVGIYVGDGKVVHNIGNIEEWDILDWLDEYNWDGSAACGWPSEVRGKAHFEYCMYESEYLNYLIRVQKFKNDGMFIVFE